MWRWPIHRQSRILVLAHAQIQAECERRALHLRSADIASQAFSISDSISRTPDIITLITLIRCFALVLTSHEQTLMMRYNSFMRTRGHASNNHPSSAVAKRLQKSTQVITTS
jgi:hypothetical protein